MLGTISPDSLSPNRYPLTVTASWTLTQMQTVTLWMPKVWGDEPYRVHVYSPARAPLTACV